MLRLLLHAFEQQREGGLGEEEAARRADGEGLAECRLVELEERLSGEAARGVEYSGLFFPSHQFLSM